MQLTKAHYELIANLISDIQESVSDELWDLQNQYDRGHDVDDIELTGGIKEVVKRKYIGQFAAANENFDEKKFYSWANLH